MLDDRWSANRAHIKSHMETIGSLLRRLWEAWRGPRVYRRGEHYMRGPGPKWREKHGEDPITSPARQPVVLGDKWDF